MTRTLGAIVLGLILVGVLFGWWFRRSSSPEESFSRVDAVNAAAAQPVQQPPAQPPAHQVNLIFPDNINVTVKKEKTQAAPSPRRVVRRTPLPPPNHRKAAPAPSKPQPVEPEEKEITPEFLEWRFKKHLHNKTQEFLRQYPRQ